MFKRRRGDEDQLRVRNEFSRLVPLEKVHLGEIREVIEADAGERAALAKRFGLVALDRLTASLNLRAGEGNAGIMLSGDFATVATQTCVVTLRPVTQNLEGSLELYFTTTPSGDSAKTEAFDAEETEPVGPGGIDIGEAVAQQLSLTLDPYPRIEGAAFDGNGLKTGATQPKRESGFSVLKDLKF